MRPLFILSLPRSGSTLLQRILAANSSIATHAEPWILLPLFFARRWPPGRAPYDAVVAHEAITEFLTSENVGISRFDEAVVSFANSLYTGFSQPDVKYFLDKTPRYSLIADDLLRAFDDARFIFLWRRPSAVISSMLRTWTAGRWQIEPFADDLFEGLPNLVKSYNREESRCHSLRYEDLVEDPSSAVEGISEYLRTRLRIPGEFQGRGFAGSFGDDPLESADKRASRTSDLDQLSTPLRQRWVRRYLTWLGESRLTTMGYELENLVSELDAQPLSVKKSMADLVAFPMQWTRLRARPWLEHGVPFREALRARQPGRRSSFRKP